MSQPVSQSLKAFSIHPETVFHNAGIEALYDASFGPVRFTRAAHFIREMAGVDDTLARVGLLDGELVSSIRFSKVRIGGVPALILGPLVVSPKYRNMGYGKALMGEAIAQAFSKGHQHVILVGDEPYYRFLGFKVTPYKAIRFPAPVDPARVLGLSHDGGEGFLSLKGAITPDSD